MAAIHLQNTSLSFPIYNVAARSLKKNFLRAATGGRVLQDANHRIVVHALDKITLSINHGDRVGLIGHNGAGKSSFLRLLAGIYEPTGGRLLINGHISPLLGFTQGIEGELTGYENIRVRGTLLGLSRKQIDRQIQDIASFTGLGDYLAMPTRTYSTGMLVRLAFAISSSIQPEILLIDEVFGTVDADFMGKARMRLNNLLNQASIVIMANHAGNMLSEFCNKGIVINNGSVQYFGDIENAFEIYRKNITHNTE